MSVSPENVQSALSKGLLSEDEANHLMGQSSNSGMSPLTIGAGVLGATVAGLGAAKGARGLGHLGKAIGAKGLIGGAIGSGLAAGTEYGLNDEVGLTGPALGALAGGGLAALGPIAAPRAVGRLINNAGKAAYKAGSGAVKMLDSKPGMIGAGAAGGLAGGAAAMGAAEGMAPPPEAGMGGPPPGPPPGPDPKQVEQMFSMLMDPQTDPGTKKKIMGILSDMGLMEGAPVGEGAAMGGLGGAALGAGAGGLAGSKGMLGSMPQMPAGPGASLGPKMGALGEKMGMGTPIGLKKGAGLGGALGGLAGAGLGALAGKMMGPSPAEGYEDPLM